MNRHIKTIIITEDALGSKGAKALNRVNSMEQFDSSLKF